MSDVRWLIFGEAVIGEVIAGSHRAALSQARQLLGARAVRVQSEVSIRTAELELPAAIAHRLYGTSGEPIAVLVPSMLRKRA